MIVQFDDSVFFLAYIKRMPMFSTFLADVFHMAYRAQQVRGLLGQDLLNTMDPPKGNRLAAHTVIVGGTDESRQAIIQEAIEETAELRQQKVLIAPPPGLRQPRELVVMPWFCGEEKDADVSHKVRPPWPRLPIRPEAGVAFSSAPGQPASEDEREAEFARLNNMLVETFPGAGGGVIVLHHVDAIDVARQRFLARVLATERLRQKGLFNVHVIWPVNEGATLPAEMESAANLYRLYNLQEESAYQRQMMEHVQKGRRRQAQDLAKKMASRVAEKPDVMDSEVAKFANEIAPWDDDSVSFAVAVMSQELGEQIPSLCGPIVPTRPGIPPAPRGLTTEVKKSLIAVLRNTDPNMPQSRIDAFVQGLVGGPMQMGGGRGVPSGRSYSSSNQAYPRSSTGSGYAPPYPPSHDRYPHPQDDDEGDERDEDEINENGEDVSDDDRYN